MSTTTAMRLVAVLGFMGVALGAFGAHGLKDTLESNGTVSIWEKAVLYHFVHTLAMLILACQPVLRVGPYGCFLAGILIFSGSLYLLAVTDMKWLGAVTPIGGLSFLAGWVWLLVQPGITAAGKG